MAGNLTNTLFPPVTSTFMPAFPRTEDAYVYYTLSPFNEDSEIYRVHYSVVDQITNESVINNSTGIAHQQLNYDTDLGMYYIRIPASEIKGAVDNENDKEATGWLTNRFYKVQIRFDGNETTEDVGEIDLSVSTNLANWNAYLISDYQRNFSE